MGISLDSAMGIHDDALLIRVRRAEILASNLANADTPHYKSRDLDFKDVLRQSQPDTDVAKSIRLIRTHANHVTGAGQSWFGTTALYRVPTQASLDGNTVDADVERSEFTKNSVAYLVSLRLLGGKFKSMLSAVKGD